MFVFAFCHNYASKHMHVRKATQKDTSFCHLLFIFQGAISAVSGILKQLKRPHKKVAVNPYDISELKTSLQSCENTNCTVLNDDMVSVNGHLSKNILDLCFISSCRWW